MKKSEEIRNSFINFFKKNNHSFLESSTLVPSDDPTLLFTNAGMVPFKNWFTGDEIPKFSNLATYQKCLRAGGKHNDLDNVGFTPRHHTFFEMLGNFSFGSYFKDEAISLAWRLLTKEFCIDKKKLYVTVYYDDDESEKIWKKISGFEDSKIIKIKSDDNFWSMGTNGPCGPCSEIFFDYGNNIKGGLPGTKSQDGPRFVEIWNLVFMQYNKIENRLEKLPKKCVDTGMGLERITAVLNGKSNNFEITEFLSLISELEKIINIKPSKNNIHSYRIIADHIRAIVFIISEGIIPSNEGRGYVLRRIIRRAARQLSELGCKGDILCKLVHHVCDKYKTTYFSLQNAKEFIYETLKNEEKKFSETIFEGNKLIMREIKNTKSKKFPSEIIFKLYDTYGFPYDLTEDILKKNNFEIDKKELKKINEEQRNLSKKTWVGSANKFNGSILNDLKEKLKPTNFLGYKKNILESKLLLISRENKNIDKTSNLDEFILVFESTPFYAESGGQIGDSGYLKNKSGEIICEIYDTSKNKDGIYFHHVKKLKNKNLEVDKFYLIEIDHEKRKLIRNNHSATHLLHESLRRELGSHVTQKGSLVTDKKLRFDFTNNKPLSKEQLENIELVVNEAIRNNLKIQLKNVPLKEAFENGAIGLFGEKYPETVRVVNMENNLKNTHNFSSELCGGTHVDYTGEIGFFKIISETSVASGIRRIEAFTGKYSEGFVEEKLKIIEDIKSILKTTDENILEKIKSLKNKSLISSSLKNNYDDLINEKFLKIHNNIKYYYQLVDIPPSNIKSFSDLIRSKTKPDIFLIISKYESKLSMIVGVNEHLEKYDSVDFIKKLVPIIGGKGGGGRKTLAQGGGNDLTKVDEVIKKFISMI